MNIRKKIYIFDDNVAIHALIEKALGGVYDLIRQTSPDNIEKLLELGMPDLIIMDILMPGVVHDGATATVWLKSNPKYKDIPVIIITSIAQGTLVDTGFIKEKTKADAVMFKPIDAAELRQNITDLLKRNRI